MAVPRSRILDLMRAQCRIFNTTFNPTGQRQGGKVLRQRLRGPAIVDYYPPRVRVVQELKRAYPTWEFEDEEEDDRLESIKMRKQRGKGAPKKRTAAESKQLTKRRPKN
ncbi:hypothetical protein EJ06DRAFT_579368 [Trichodelitschia bisporula]|uniref:Small ribosomal subunit protein mS33 n=1 Tax=Trichodelitschia bisporula TaxID=703511 RepID=A0A6G1I9U6_9PEZI|nr:hypothetical protein EJ06DRAFT_579368 [Trichodelitschia bisporula]